MIVHPVLAKRPTNRPLPQRRSPDEVVQTPAMLQPKAREEFSMFADQQVSTPEALSAQTQNYGKAKSLVLQTSTPPSVSRQTSARGRGSPHSARTVVEPDIEPTPRHVTAVKGDVHGSLQKPLLPGTVAQGPVTAVKVDLHGSLQKPLLPVTVAQEPSTKGPSRQKGRICLYAPPILLPIWGAAAILGLTVSCMAQTLHALRVATSTRLPSPLDFTLRLAVAPEKCLGSMAIEPQSPVVLQACSAKESQQFLLLKDGTIRSRYEERFCVTSTPANKLMLTLCAHSDTQVFEVQPSGKLALKAKPAECLNLLQGDFDAGIVGMSSCSGGLDEVFVYGGGHFLVPALEQELSQVRSLSPQKAANASLLQQNIEAMCALSVIAFMLSTFRLIAAHPARKHKLLHCLALGVIACMIILVCSSLLLARTATQEAERATEKAKVLASAQSADLDFTLRMTKATHLCLGAEGLQDKAKVGLQQCKASATQQFILKNDGTIRTKTVDGLCLTVEPTPNKLTLLPCSTRESRNQVFSEHAEGHGWLQLHSLPSMCLNLLGGDEKAGHVGLYQCGSDLNEVFVYSGGNVAISGLASQLHRVRQLLQQGSRPLESDFASIFTVGGVACFLLLTAPSLLLLPGLMN
mmetsp:Transcript_70652/g.136341  ORF Transcript_70652/g.136341 Transcript_70652/m.136341 type:complete len:634 (+) Transcript_70652:90-1991(+)|eukprot:CAMPEP_0172660548 /NCGR_PEP_ID=MMETSP1074-20121228/4125_1 /TAXON_ID=2916 /ORGANISM="Ceratium fusus, Strain PA161109" /LENGTH=633 /DNA_ID=CAMNT_0013476179 /DNA_START=82 /DNA_END=1983 /DNA_ORIENTATION=+